MKVVIFCGGLGVRMGEAAQRVPKPMISVGNVPILFHVMRWYASWGHTEFILCLGYRGDEIKRWFLSYQEAIGNDFVMDGGSGRIDLLGRDMDGWRITFVDTGLNAPIGQRLKAVESLIGDDEVFLATYGDGLTDAPLSDMIERLRATDKTALFLSVQPRLSYHVTHTDDDGVVNEVESMENANIWINGGFFVFNRAIFDVIEPGEDLVEEPFTRLIHRGDLLAYRYRGFWAPMDTIKDKQMLDLLLESGNAPWRHAEPAVSNGGALRAGKAGLDDQLVRQLEDWRPAALP
jgi:glucose-1-phosphate cytidylyltransferase